ncbi:ATP-binding protein [Streptomyces sp. A5-4]|uniref:ATP-binding protein n=1 Tax=Streptomyces sp. A5-4 TaxID=3384771 RepID=UPI003DA9BC58
MTTLVRREGELRHVREALARHRLVSLTGVGGVGKSRLALRAARQAAPRYPDGVWWVDLAPLRDEGLLLATVSDAVDFADHTPRMQVAALCEWLADKRLLLVLDSCEHLVDACRGLVGDLLTAAPGLTVLVTSRQPLGADCEQLVEVEPLAVEGDSDALALFVERAAVAVPGFTLADPRLAAAATGICRRLDGIPLALELADAQLKHTSVEQLAGLLDAHFESLSPAEWAATPRHRTLRTAIGWSHELCEPLERLLWARLSTFRAAFDEPSARDVCAGGPLDGDGVRRALAGLVAKSVVKREGTRYRMLGAIQDYGRMWLEELGEGPSVAARHAAHFLTLAHRADAGWLGPAQVAWYQRVADVHIDLCAALEHLLVTDPARALELAGLTGFYWSCCGHLHEARSYLERALALPQEPGPARTRALWALGIALLLQGEHRAASELGQQCTLAARHGGDPEATFAAAYLVGLTHLMEGRPLAAYTLAEHVLDAAPDSPFASASRLRCHLVQVFALTALGKLSEARSQALELRAGCLRLDEWWTRSYTDYQLSLIALFQDRPDEAAVHARAMLAEKQQLGDSFGIALGLDLLAAAVAAQGDGERAAMVYGTGQAYWRNVGHPQRGTPELRAVREECEARSRAAIGDLAYAQALGRGAAGSPKAALARALEGGDPPSG